MKAMTILAAAALAAGLYHYRRYVGRGRAAPEPRITDAVLAERVRDGIAGATSSAVDVRAADGIVTLRGTVKRAERDLALAAALGVPGVRRVTNQLEVEDLSTEPGAQGAAKTGFAGGR